MSRFIVKDVKATKHTVSVKIDAFGGTWMQVPDKDLQKALRIVPNDKRFAVPLLQRRGYINLSNINAGSDVPITPTEKRKYKRQIRIRRRKMRYTIDFKMPAEKDTKEKKGISISQIWKELEELTEPEIWKIHDIRENKIEIELPDRTDKRDFYKFLAWLEGKTYIEKVTGIRRVEK